MILHSFEAYPLISIVIVSLSGFFFPLMAAARLGPVSVSNKKIYSIIHFERNHMYLLLSVTVADVSLRRGFLAENIFTDGTDKNKCHNSLPITARKGISTDACEQLVTYQKVWHSSLCQSALICTDRPLFGVDRMFFSCFYVYHPSPSYSCPSCTYHISYNPSYVSVIFYSL